MFTRRGFIRIGAASVGSLALRPFGVLPAMAQNGPDYRALVCIFLFGGNDSNNTVDPHGRRELSSLYLHSRQPRAWRSASLTPTVYTASGSALRVSWQADRSRQPVFIEGTGRGGKRRLAGAAAHARAVSGAAGARFR